MKSTIKLITLLVIFAGLTLNYHVTGKSEDNSLWNTRGEERINDKLRKRGHLEIALMRTHSGQGRNIRGRTRTKKRKNKIGQLQRALRRTHSRHQTPDDSLQAPILHRRKYQ